MILTPESASSAMRANASWATAFAAKLVSSLGTAVPMKSARPARRPNAVWAAAFATTFVSAMATAVPMLAKSAAGAATLATKD